MTDATALSSANSIGDASKKPLLLIVDNQATSIQPLCDMLKDDYEICMAASGLQALNFCETRLPDLIFLEVMMPGMSGHEVCRRIKLKEESRNIPIIFIAEQNTPAEEATAFADGGVDYITKPFHEQVVKARVRTQIMIKSQSDLLRTQATIDGLTGLSNRRRLDDVLDQECRRAARDGTLVSIALLDIDRFKAYNDHYGHQEGDECLRAVSSVIKSFGRRPGDLCARYGGEEFAIVLSAVNDEGATKIADAIRTKIELLGLPHIGNDECNGVVTASIGVATAGQNGVAVTPKALIAAADEMLYEAKRTGRNKVVSQFIRLVDPVPPPLPNEEARANLVEEYLQSDDGKRAGLLDSIAQLAAAIIGAPIGLVSLVGRDQQTFVGRYGFDAHGTGRDVSFCAHVITGDRPMVVANAMDDPRFRNNPLVTGDPNIRFYAGAPLISSQDEHHYGALCVIDREPHQGLSEQQRLQLANLSALAMQCIEGRA